MGKSKQAMKLQCSTAIQRKKAARDAAAQASKPDPVNLGSKMWTQHKKALQEVQHGAPAFTSWHITFSSVQLQLQSTINDGNMLKYSLLEAGLN